MAELIVETGSIISGADSYVSRASAVTFLDNFYGEYDEEAAAFLGVSTSKQNILLRRAAYDLDRKYRLHWKGIKIQQDQSLDWPRYDVVDEDGWWVPPDTVPLRVQRAQVEIAKRLAVDTAIFEDRDRGGLVQSEKVDVIAISYFASAPAATLFEGLDAVLKGLLKTENIITRA